MFNLTEDFGYLEGTWVDVEELKEFITMYSHGTLENLFEEKPYNKENGRDYKSDYKKFQSSDKQKKDRAARNSARAEEERNGNVRKGDGKDVHHVDGNPQNNSKKNIRIVSKSKNRGDK